MNLSVKSFVQTFLVVVVIIFIFVRGASGADKEATAINNLASDHVECAVYYFFAADAVKNANFKDSENVIKNLENLSVFFLEGAITISNKEVTEARFRLYTDEQTELIKHSYSNMAILIEKYGEFCKNLFEDPAQRLQFWRDKASERDVAPK